VSRHLKRAREEGLVRIEIVRPRRQNVDLGRELADRFGLARAVVAPTDPDLDVALGPVAADFVGGLLRSGLRLGVSWGRTLAAVIRHLRPGLVANLEIAQLAGGVHDPTPGIQGHELVRQLATLYPHSRVSTSTRRRSSTRRDPRGDHERQLGARRRCPSRPTPISRWWASGRWRRTPR
jgi:DNA-binding transcriptional regulator LsrR (DeoR family)